MASPFPGMDPYLEHPEIFPDLHDSFITYLREALQASLPAPYFAVIGRRVWIEFSRRSIGPDVEVRRGGAPSTHMAQSAGSVAVADPVIARPVLVKVAHDELRESFVEIYTRGASGKRLVTSIELLSLANKTPGHQGRDLFKRKQAEILASQVHLVEIDLLRAGEHTTAVPLEAAVDECGPFDYHACVHCFDAFGTFLVYPIHLEDRLPAVAIPLLPDDSPVTVELQSILSRCYDAGPYSREILYGEDAVAPPLRPEHAHWASQVLSSKPGPILPG
jgi:hypothetical protein